MPPQFLVFQHGPWERPGRFLLRTTKELGIRLKIVKVWQHPIPRLSAYDGLIVLGGSPNVDQERQYPFLISEKQAIRESIAEDRPYLGFCLGHQLLADALGAKVGPNFRPSVGFVQGFLTSAGREHPAFYSLPKELTFYKWHGQTVMTPVPSHLAVLATSADCQVEAISVENRPHILGLQFDNHAADPHDVAVWLAKDQKWLASLPLDLDPAAILRQAEQHKAILAQDFTRLLTNYFSLLGCTQTHASMAPLS
jgi:GMP synthase (glutamine-hydrolysing)